jgi:PHS family inorganic phosphate transporter-like MFS transporter
MMAAVFFMQPLGQLAAQLVGLLVSLGINKQMDLQKNCIDPKNETCVSGVDRIWRIVTGVGAGPALLAIVFRFLIWDSGLYDLEVKKETPRAFRNTQRVYRNVRVNSSVNIPFQNGNTNAKEGDSPVPLQFSKHDLHRYFIAEGNWRTLAGASVCWFLLDFAFFGIGMGNPRTIAKIFATWDSKAGKIPTPPSWNTNPTYALNATTLKSNATIYDSLLRNPIQSMETVSIASILGSLLFILVVNYVPRRQWLIYSFISQAILFIVTGGTFYAVFHKENHAVTVCLVAVCHFLFNFGANTLTFMVCLFQPTNH